MCIVLPDGDFELLPEFYDTAIEPIADDDMLATLWLLLLPLSS